MNSKSNTNSSYNVSVKAKHTSVLTKEQEKEKLSKQKQMYQRHLKGKLKKESDEVINLKKENFDLKEAIRSNNAKSTSTISTLCNQLQIIEKENKKLKEVIEKLKKENKCIKHSNDISRRLTDIKYLEQINKKLNNMASEDVHSDIVHDPYMKYKVYEIDQHNRPRKSVPACKGTRTRSISVPNLNVTSRYAKYLNWKSSLSDNDLQRNTLTSRNSNSSKSPSSMYQENNEQREFRRSKSPEPILSNESSSSPKCGTVMNRDTYFNPSIIPSPEPVRESSITETNLNLTEIRKSDGSKEIRFPNGNVKTISADGQYSRFMYYNGDIKEKFYNGGRKYYYAETKTFHTTCPDGLDVMEFPDGQVEKRYPDGSLEIRFPNGNVRYFDPKNEHVHEEWRFADSSVMTISAKGEKSILFANGQIEVHTKEHKRREFPDGTVKLIYNDGTLETRYPSSRVRTKDKHGNVIMDSDPRQ